MSVFELDTDKLVADAQVWEDAAGSMREVSSNLGSAYVTALPPSVTSAASAFLDTWARYAEESAEIAAGLAEGLRDTALDASRTDESTQADLERLDSRLGPAQ